MNKDMVLACVDDHDWMVMWAVIGTLLVLLALIAVIVAAALLARRRNSQRERHIQVEIREELHEPPAQGHQSASRINVQG